MAGKQATVPLKVGDVVKIRHYGRRGRVVEFRGPLGPGGALVYRVIVRRKPKPGYIDLTEDLLTLIPPEKPSGEERGRGS
jgi:hypothetical protein